MSAADRGKAGPAMRVGHGYDAHPFGDAADLGGRTLVLGGIQFVGERPLAGHSDADVVAHAVIDAMLSAAGLGDIGTHFPDSDERWRGADSIEMLAQVAALLAEDGWQLANADCTVICDRPMIAPHRDQMQECLSGAAGGPVTVCGKRTEGLGGADGIVAHAVALLLASGEQRSTQVASGEQRSTQVVSAGDR
ncbi:2-C-methyl-D-erythritol 2,4-cyclodiphosphate synthase [Candidatus Poriferisodalis sp.]|uniref:2-C-methyl-D-erythritol 2,4-cyclodiphosphate synthase n=1 Tax=Candidatus Poriferisodalis sp. TaxID=3101277 RepID=UPI003AF819C1